MKSLRCLACMAVFYALVSATSFAAPVPAASSSARGFQLIDLRRLVSLSEPQISPNGKEIAVIASRPLWKTDDTKDEIDLIDVATGKFRSLTFDRTGLDAPRWSPDGTRLAFIADAPSSASSEDPEDTQSQLFVMPMNGGDPVQTTYAQNGVDEYAWSPDGKRIAYVVQDSPPQSGDGEKYDNAFKVSDNNYTTRAAVLPWHLWVVPATGGQSKRLTKGPWSLDTDQGTAMPLTWSRDGRMIVFTRFPDTYYGNAYRSTIAEVPADGGKVQTLVAAEGSGGLAYASDGKAYAFIRPRNGDQNNGNAVYVHAAGKTYDPTAALARNIEDFRWLPHDNALLMTGEDGSHMALWRQPLDGSAEQLNLGNVSPSSSLSIAQTGAVAFVGDTAQHPDELYVMTSIHSKPRRLSDFNAFVDAIKLGRVASIAWQGPNGFREDGVLTYPVGFQAGRKYPLVLVIHGGPEGATMLDFDPMTQILAARGFLVFRPNYRGSINLGDAYQHAIYRDTGEGPGKDVMAGLAAVEKLDIVDTNRIGVSGWSYGGYMTSWLNGNYPSTWKAAVEGAALNDWVMDYTISFYQKGDLYFFGGSPWTKQYTDIWRQQSPIEYAHNVTAPTLILADVGDPNVPIVNSYEMYHALRDNGVTTEFYAYPADTHFPHDIVRTTDVYRRWIDWMVKYLKPTAD
ncbi:MAG: S9 family peptidase [Gammaproteobacteria bacterium]